MTARSADDVGGYVATWDAFAGRAEVLLRGDRDDRVAMAEAARLLELALGLDMPNQPPGSWLDEAAVIAGRFDQVCPHLPQRRRVARVNNLALAYRLLGVVDPEPSLRDAAVAARRLAVRLAAGDLERGRLACHGLAEDLRIRWESHGDWSDLVEAIVLCRGVAGLDDEFEQVAGQDAGHVDRARGNALATLCTLLRLRYETGSDERDLSLAIRVGRWAVAEAEPGSVAWHSRNNNLSIALHDRWLMRRSLSDVDEAVATASLAVDATRKQTGADAARWGTLGTALRSRFIHESGATAFHPPDPLDLRSVRSPPAIGRDDIDGAIDAFDRAARLSGATDLDLRRSRLVAALLTRYDTFRDRPDIERAVALARRISVGEDVAPLILNQVAYALGRAGTDLRVPALVSEAITLGQRALAGLAGGANEAMALENLGIYYRAREFLQAMDLHRVTTIRGRATDRYTGPDGCTDKHQGGQAGGDSDAHASAVNTAIRTIVGAAAGATGSPAHPELGHRTVWRQAATSPLAPAWYRISAARRWAEATYAGLPEDVSSLEAYGIALDLITSVATVGIDRRSREAQLRDVSVIARDAAAATVQGGRPDDAQAVLETGRAVLWSESVTAHSLTVALADADPVLAERVSMVTQSLWRTGPERAQTTAARAASSHRHDGAGRRHATTNGATRSATDGATDSAAQGSRCASEEGRANSSGGPVDGLFGGPIASAPAIVRPVPTAPKRPLDGPNPRPLPDPVDSIERAAGSAASGSATRSGGVQHDADPVDRRLALAQEWDGLLDEVRALPGFETFLRPPTYDDLLQAAAHGPVVTVNVSEWRCDAFVLTTTGVEAVALPALTLHDAEQRLARHLETLAAFDESVSAFEEADRAWQSNTADVRAIRQRQEAGARRRSGTMALDDELGDLVGWLWDVVVEPLLDWLPAPGADGIRPRVWWCPTGPLAFLPLHAAGRGSQWLHDRVVSSTTPTVRSLLDARNDGRRQTESLVESRVEPQDEADGGSVPSEDTERRQRFLVASTFASTRELMAGPLSLLTQTEFVECSDLAGVRRNLTSCDFVHFDCHGDQVLDDPSQGGVRLADGVLRVFDVAMISATGEFAGLAACKTAVGGVDLLDEAITLSAALHYAGFRHVVGALWNLSEGVAQTAFANMYSRLVAQGGAFDPTGSARALAAAVDQLRESGESLHSWASLIHIGP